MTQIVPKDVISSSFRAVGGAFSIEAINDPNFKIQYENNAELYDILKFIRNSFIHCDWDISKLDYRTQEQRIRDYASNNTLRTLNFPNSHSTISNDIVSIKGLEPLCNCLIEDSSLS